MLTDAELRDSVVDLLAQAEADAAQAIARASRYRRILELLDRGELAPATDPPDTETEREREREPEPGPVEETTGEWRCPDCGTGFRSDRGLKVHVGLMHKRSFPDTELRPQDVTTVTGYLPVTEQGLLAARQDARDPVSYVCADCDFEGGDLGDIRQHVAGEHKRPMHKSERIPWAAAS